MGFFGEGQCANPHLGERQKHTVKFVSSRILGNAKSYVGKDRYRIKVKKGSLLKWDYK